MAVSVATDLSLACTRMLSVILSSKRTSDKGHMYLRLPTHLHVCTCTCARTHTHNPTQNTHTHTHTHTQTHTHTHTPPHTHTHTPTHTEHETSVLYSKNTHTLDKQGYPLTYPHSHAHLTVTIKSVTFLKFQIPSDQKEALLLFALSFRGIQ